MQDADGGAVEHRFLSVLLEAGLCREQRQQPQHQQQQDEGNLETFECIVRRLQVCVKSVRQKVEVERLDVVPYGRALSSDFFSGRARLPGGAVFCPMLVSYVAERMHEESELMKRQCKVLDARGKGGKKT